MMVRDGELVDKRYLVIDHIGEGGMGTVVKVTDQQSGVDFALKFCRETDDGALKRFAREVRIMTDTIHPNVITVLDSNVDHRPPYFIMPLAWTNLSKLIPKLKGQIEDIMPLFDEICKGISAMHTTGHYHRDIKPSNVLWLEHGGIVVSDFGLSKKVIKDSSTHSSSNNFLGTLGYHAPEQFEAKNSDARTDIFQLGKTLYEIYTGDYPHLINTAKVKPGLAYIIQKATNHDPNKRYQTVGELQQALKTYVLSLDPNSNPKDAFENKLNEAKAQLNNNQYDDGTVISLLETLSLVKDDYQSFLEYFHKIPNTLLKVLSNQLENVFGDTLDIYTQNLNEFFDNWGYDFSYAETVAEKMSVIFKSAKKIEFKEIALYNTLVAAIRCNRFKAMDTFDGLLVSIVENDEAIAISGLLEKEIDWYRHLYDRVPKNRLHYLLQPIWEKAKQLILKEKEEEERKRQEWLKNLDF